MNDLRIRPARAADAQAIARLLEQLGYPLEEGDVADRFACLSARERAEVLVAERAGAVIGLATVHVISVINRRRDVAWLTALVVDEGSRGLGVGRELVHAVEDHARRAGCERLSVTTYEGRTDAQRFYVGLGMEMNGRRFGKTLQP